MTCEPVNLGNGSFAILCGRSRGNQGRGGGRCYICNKPATHACDAPVEKGRTCDKPICAKHAQRVGPNLDICPAHQEQLAQRKAQEASP